MPQYVTRGTLQKINMDVKDLEKRLLEQARIVRQAIESGGGTHDNAMYDAALQEQAILAERLERLKCYLRDPSVIEDFRAPANSVTIGKIVVLENLQTGTKSRLLLLGPADVEYAVPGAISYLSPVAQQLLGKRMGDVVKINVPGGEYDAEINEILEYEHSDIEV